MVNWLVRQKFNLFWFLSLIIVLILIVLKSYVIPSVWKQIYNNIYYIIDIILWLIVLLAIIFLAWRFLAFVSNSLKWPLLPDFVALSLLKVMHQMISPLRWLGRFWGWVLSGERFMIVRLIAIVAIMMIISDFMYPLDPAGLDFKLTKINGSSFEQPTLQGLIGNISDTFTSGDTFTNKFQKEGAFSKILSNDTILTIMIKNERLFQNFSPILDNESPFLETFKQKSNYYLCFKALRYFLWVTSRY